MRRKVVEKEIFALELAGWKRTDAAATAKAALAIETELAAASSSRETQRHNPHDRLYSLDEVRASPRRLDILVIMAY